MVELAPEDQHLFYDGNWLNSNCIEFYYRTLEKGCEATAWFTEKIILMDPSVVSFLRFQVEDEEEKRDFLHGNDIVSHDWVFIPVNNNQSLFDQGTHWSLLVYSVLQNRGVHLDSMQGRNNEVAKQIMDKLLGCLALQQAAGDPRQTAEFEVIPTFLCAQQQDSFNCGIYVCMFTEKLIEFMAEDQLSDPFDPLFFLESSAGQQARDASSFYKWMQNLDQSQATLFRRNILMHSRGHLTR